MIAMTLSQYIVCFIIYSFLGWLYESIFYSLQFKKLVNTGFLHGCICPIYGLACVMNTMLLKNVHCAAAVFILSILIISAIEYGVSYTLERLFDKRWWDYSDWPANINGRISLFSSLGFGAMSVFQMFILNPAVDTFIMRMSDKMIHTVIFMFIICIAGDLLLTVRDMDKNDERLWFLDETSPMVSKASEKIVSGTRNLSDRYTDIRKKFKERTGK